MPTDAVWTCDHCHAENRRNSPLGRVAEEFVCWKCGNTGKGTIPGAGFTEGGGRSLLVAADEFA